MDTFLCGAVLSTWRGALGQEVLSDDRQPLEGQIGFMNGVRDLWS
jgi:hypothetical protein